MGGIYTSRRNTPRGRLQVSKQKNLATGVETPIGFDGSYAWNSTQVTTSYRSRGRIGDEEFIPTTTREFLALEEEKGNLSSRSSSPIFDKGHEFNTVKVVRDGGFTDNGQMEVYSPSSGGRLTTVSHPHSNLQYRVNGVFRLLEADPDPSWFITTDDIVSGKQLFNKAAPNKPSANAAVFLGEILSPVKDGRSGLPSLSAIWQLRDRASAIRAVGSEYLNVQFGWIPFIKDVIDIAKALSNASNILLQYSRDSGRVVRRRVSLPRLERTLYLEGADVIGGSAAFLEGYKPDGTALGSTSGGFSASLGSAKVVSITAKQDRWFSGAFTYYVPKGSDNFFENLPNFEANLAKLLGTRVTPEVIWELTPWSWLVDWFLNLQVHLNSYSRITTDGLVLRYGYLMVRDQISVNALFPVSYVSNDAGHPTVSKQAFTRVTYDRKRRIKSTPYGFGITPSSFTANQWTILAALGMTKAPRTLR